MHTEVTTLDRIVLVARQMSLDLISSRFSKHGMLQAELGQLLNLCIVENAPAQQWMQRRFS